MDTAEMSKTKFRRIRRAFFALIIAVVTISLGGFALHRAWTQTMQREAHLPELEAIVIHDPFDGRTLALLGARYCQAYEYSSAAAVLLRAVGAGETDARVWLTWAAAVAASGDRAQADSVLLMGMRDKRVSVPLRAALDRSAGLPAQAQPAEVAHAICPNGTGALANKYASGSFLNGIAEWWGRRHPMKSGFATRERWAREQPHDPFVLRLWGESLARNHRYSEADAVLREVLKMEPQSPAAHLALGSVLEKQRSIGKAGLEFLSALKARPDWQPALLGMGRVALDQKLIPICLDVFKRVTRQSPDLADGWIGLGRSYYIQHKYEDSKEAFDRAASIAPRRTDFFNDYSSALRGAFRNDLAEEILRRRRADAPEDSKCLYLLSLILSDVRPNNDRLAEAEGCLRRSLEIQPGVAAVELHLGRLLIDDGKIEEATQALENAVKHDRYSTAAMSSLARAYTKSGRTKEAKTVQESLNTLSGYVQKVSFLEDQVRQQPTSLKLHQELAALFESGGETEKAAHHREMGYYLKIRGREAKTKLGNLRDYITNVVPPTR